MFFHFLLVLEYCAIKVVLGPSTETVQHHATPNPEESAGRDSSGEVLVVDSL